MSTLYSCQKCRYSFVVRPGEITTADLKTHCDAPMHISEISEEEAGARATLSARMRYFGITDYDVRNRIVYWRGQDIGGMTYLNSRSMDQMAAILDQARKQAQE